MGSEDNNCNGYTGKCFCKSPTISGDNCDKCVRTYFGFPNCQGNIFPEMRTIQYLISQTNLAYPVYQPVCVMKKELLTKIVLLRMGNVLVDQTLLDTSVTNVPQVSLDFLTVNVSNKKLILHSNQHRGNYALSCILQLHQAVAASLLEETFIWNFEFKMANKFLFTHRNKVIFKQLRSFSACQCSEDGSRDVSCDNNTGKCSCKTNVIGDKCNFCSPGFHTFPICEGTWYT